MKLTAGQLTEIKQYIQDMGIKYLDVQMEILDHTACKVEEKLQAYPDLDFDKAFYQTKVDIGNLIRIQKSYGKQVRKQSTAMFFSSIIEWFKGPKLLFTTLISVFIWLLATKMGLVQATKFLIAIGLVSTFIDFLFIAVIYPDSKRLLTIRNSHFSALPLIFIVLWKQYIEDSPFFLEWYGTLLFTVFTVFYILSILGSYKVKKYVLKRYESLIILYNI